LHVCLGRHAGKDIGNSGRQVRKEFVAWIVFAKLPGALVRTISLQQINEVTGQESSVHCAECTACKTDIRGRENPDLKTDK
jgi:hypothetical protein